jgi:hypothetical protein
VARHHPQRHPHLRIPLPEHLQRSRQVHRRDRRDHADHDPAAHLPHRRGNLRESPFREVEALPGRRQERRTRRGQPNAAAGAFEQPGTQFAFQARDLMAQRGLHDQAPPGRLREAAGLGDRHHVPHLLEFHGIYRGSR